MKRCGAGCEQRRYSDKRNHDPSTGSAAGEVLARLEATTARATLGGEVERSVLPVASVSFIYSASFSTFWVYVGVYAVKGLGWPASRVGLLFLFCAPAAAVANYLSGRLSDLLGRKQLIVASFALSSLNVLGLALLGHRTVIALAPVRYSKA